MQGERRGEVDRGGGLADAALLVGDGRHAPVPGAGNRCRSGCSTRAARAPPPRSGVQSATRDGLRESSPGDHSPVRLRPRPGHIAASAVGHHVRSFNVRASGRRLAWEMFHGHDRARRVDHRDPADDPRVGAAEPAAPWRPEPLGPAADAPLEGDQSDHRSAAAGRAPVGETSERGDRPSGDDVGPLPPRRTAGSSAARARSPGSARSSTTSRSQSTRRAIGSTRTSEMSGRAITSGIPGSPAPDPTIDDPGAPGASATTALLSTCRSHSRGTSRGPISPRATPVESRNSTYGDRGGGGPRTLAAAPPSPPPPLRRFHVKPRC